MESRDEVKKTEGEREERNGGTKDRWRKKERGSRMKALVEMPFRKEKKTQQKRTQDTLYAIDYY